MIYFNEAFEQSVLLPTTGIAYTDVTVSVYKQGATSYVTKAITEDNWKEIGFGLYILSFAASEIDTLGIFVVSIRTGYGEDFVEERVIYRPAYEVVPPNICRIYGNVLDLGGRPDDQPVITARLVNVPFSTPGGSMVTSKAISALIDTIGNFYIDVIREATVVLEVEYTGVRVQITVPDEATANIKDLLP